MPVAHAKDKDKDKENPEAAPLQPKAEQKHGDEEQGGGSQKREGEPEQGNEKKVVHPSVNLTNPTSGLQYPLKGALPVDYEVTAAATDKSALVHVTLRDSTGKVVMHRNANAELDPEGKGFGTSLLHPSLEGIAGGKYKIDCWVETIDGGSSAIKSIDVELIDEEQGEDEAEGGAGMSGDGEPTEVTGGGV